MKLSQLVVATVLIGSTFSLFAEESRYIITDLGDDAWISAVNNSGQGAGYAKIGYQAVVTDSIGNVFFLGTPAEHINGLGICAINDSGQAIFNLPVAGEIAHHAFVTDSNNNLIDLGRGRATAINNSGQVTGYSRIDGTTGYHAFVTDSNNNIIDLGTLETGGDSKGYDINESGQVVGGSEIVRTNGRLYAFVTDSNFNMAALTHTGFSQGISGFTKFINNSGLVAGFYTGGFDYVIDSNGEMIRFQDYRIEAINDNGQVTGNSGYIYGGYSHAFVTKDSSYEPIDLGTLGGLQSEASAMNKSGQVVGYSEINELNLDVRAFITDSDNNMIELGTLVDNLSNNWEYLSYANDISDMGYIIGEGKTINGDHHAYLLTPLALAPVITYSWYTDSWGRCTGSCGADNGARFRTVYCKSSTGEQVLDINCTQPKHATIESCIVSNCEMLCLMEQIVETSVTYGNGTTTILGSEVRISTSGTVTVEAGGIVEYYAEHITLTQGFWAKSGGMFRAVTEPVICSRVSP